MRSGVKFFSKRQCMREFGGVTLRENRFAGTLCVVFFYWSITLAVSMTRGGHRSILLIQFSGPADTFFEMWVCEYINNHQRNGVQTRISTWRRNFAMDMKLRSSAEFLLMFYLNFLRCFSYNSLDKLNRHTVNESVT